MRWRTRYETQELGLPSQELQARQVSSLFDGFGQITYRKPVEAGGVEPQGETLQIVPWHRPLTAPMRSAPMPHIASMKGGVLALTS